MGHVPAVLPGVALDDILISPVVINDTVTVNVVTDRRAPAKGNVVLTAMKLDGTPVWSKKFGYTARPLTSKCIFSAPVADVLAGNDRRDIIFTASFTTGDREYNNVAFATKQKNMNYTRPNLAIDIKPAGDGYDVTLGSDVFARAVFLSLDGIDNFFSDNYFNILPGGRREILPNVARRRGRLPRQPPGLGGIPMERRLRADNQF